MSNDENNKMDKTNVVDGDTLKVRLDEAKKVPPALVLLMGPTGIMGKQWPLDRNEMFIGRDASCDIHIDEKSLSKKHAKLIKINEQINIVDLQSTNGTEITNHKLAPNAPSLLRDHDRIKCGNIIFKYLSQGNLESVATATSYDRGTIDGLTQILNKAALLAGLEDAFKKAKLTETALSLIIFDLDHFKKVNDTFGHQAGDYILREVCSVVKNSLIRAGDIFGRYGGEEFVIVLNGSPLQRACDVAERIRSTIEKHDFEFGGKKILVTVSLGVASLEAPMASADVLFAKADQATYASKNQAETVFQLFDLPPAFEAHLETRLKKFSHSLTAPEKLGASIRQLSNLFIRSGFAEDYWKNNDHRASYTAYFTILNFLRARSVFSEARHRGFLNGMKNVVDWGCGAGAASLAMAAEWQLPEPLPHIVGIDSSQAALEEFDYWSEIFELKNQSLRKDLKTIGQDQSIAKADTLVLSYVLNEIDNWPEIPKNIEKIVVIEPSTHQAGRKLLEWRSQMQEKGWYAWAPCTHQEACPLLTQSGKDWCHHRVHWNKPNWFIELENFLPMKNDTLTLSYLLLARQPQPANLKGLSRIVGDEQEEKGKSRQMICRGPLREFLSWLHRYQFSLKLKRGDLIEILQFEQKANELRVFTSDWIRRVD